MDWKQSLDKYLTTEPENWFDHFCEYVQEEMMNEFYHKNISWIEEYDGQYNKWLNKLFDKKYILVDSSITDMAAHAARIIERAFSLYKIGKQ